MIRHGIDSVRQMVPTTLFLVRGRNLATEFSLWPVQSCGTLYQQQFVTHADSLRSFRADSHRILSLCFI